LGCEITHEIIGLKVAYKGNNKNFKKEKISGRPRFEPGISDQESDALPVTPSILLMNIDFFTVYVQGVP
jgi:hypothetical protein